MKFKRKNAYRGAQVVHIRATKGGPHNCIRCHAGAALTFLTRGLDILETLAMHKRPRCIAAGACEDSGLAMIGNEPPQVHNCEYRLTLGLARSVTGIRQQLDLILDDAERLARMAERGVDPPTNTAS